MPANTDGQSTPGTSWRRVPSTGRQVAALVGFLALSYAVCILASIPIILHSNGWFASSTQAPWMPAGWMFRTVWIGLYACIGLSGWLVWRGGALAGRVLGYYGLQLVLNLAWPLMFFAMFPMLGSAALWLAFAIICALACVLVLLILEAGPVHNWAGLLVLPYFSWVVFSASLNLYSALHN
ncbi:benzodiazapine receptor [Pseudarthrobacter sp. W1I19]|uniref:TspO/MBR family protein n=1 Tax=Pseudarthrobacter sp. W1I19 TaxID=3042288 RepID=UPI0027881E39|nr:TspO/MBR family protein [Pseudarthrobacter sp. W1I19]MDQ0923072.1 benzodiazapine receptor [Pseudarthrobacter sp. W1I19]